MITSSQKCKHNGYVVSSRLDRNTYTSLLGLMTAAGYPDVSTFVKEAVLKQAQGIAADISGLICERLGTVKH